MLARMQALECIDFVTELQIRIFDAESGVYGPPVDNVAPGELGMLIAGACSVSVNV
jgi:hypothetical protein